MTFKRSSVHLLRCTDPGFYVSGYFARVFFKYISPLSTAHLSHHAIEELAGADPKKSRKGGGGGGAKKFWGEPYKPKTVQIMFRRKFNKTLIMMADVIMVGG